MAMTAFWFGLTVGTILSLITCGFILKIK